MPLIDHSRGISPRDFKSKGLVICCDYRTSGTESGGKVKLTGAIDIPAIRTEITDVMEGGEEAFKLRQRKYGF